MLSKSEAPLVSVIVPVYGVERYLDECIESIVGQTYAELEILLVDDGSPDGCPGICDGWAARDGRIRAIHKENGGLSSARNAGLSLCSGRFVLFVDSDDFIDRSLVGSCLRAIQAAAADVVAFKLDRFNGDGVLPSDLLPRFPSGQVANAELAVSHLLLGDVQSYAVAYLARRSLFDGPEPIRFPVGELMEDVSTTYKVFARAGRIVYLDEALYHYRARQGSILSHATPQLVHAVYTSAFKRARDIDRMMPQLERESRIGLALSLIPGLITLDYICGEMDPDSYGDERNRYVKAIRGLSLSEAWGYLPSRDKFVFTLVSLHLDGAMHGFIHLKKKVGSLVRKIKTDWHR